MSSPEDTASLNREELLALVAELQRQIMALQEQVAQLRDSNQAVVAENEQLKRVGKRQAAPVSKGTQTQQPKRPGRKPGEGTFSFRQAPHPEEITELPVNVPVIQESCPVCGGELAEERVDPSARLRTGFAYITELTPLTRPQSNLVTGCGSAAAPAVAATPRRTPRPFGKAQGRLWPRTSTALLLTG